MVAIWRSIFGKKRPPLPPGAFQPSFLQDVDAESLTLDAAGALEIDQGEALRLMAEYQALHQKKRYAKRLGELKTLCFEEALLCYLMLATRRPSRIVEIGTQYGNSTRRLIDMVSELGLDAQIVTYDIEDQVKQFKPGVEAELRLEDVTGAFIPKVLEELRPEFIYLDAHPYDLLEEVIRDTMTHARDCALTVHDCGVGLCNPKMTIDRNDPGAISSATGHWERYVLADLFGVADPCSADLDRCSTETHDLRIFGTHHGLAAISPRRA